MNRVVQFKRVQEEALILFTKKNADYGDAFASCGTVGVLVRMGDKIQRALKITTTKVSFVNDETLRDSLIDLHNYAGMAVMLLDEKKKVRPFKPHFPPPPRCGWIPPPSSGLPPPPLRCGAIPPPPAPKHHKKYNRKGTYYVGQVVEILSAHKKPENVYKATIKTVPQDCKMELKLEDGKTLYLNHWALKLSQSRAVRFKQEKSPMEKKWYLA